MSLTLTTSNLTLIEGEPRVLDLVLAKSLGFIRTRKIRELIETNRQELETYGSLAPVQGKSRGQEFTEYSLNEGQAILICMFSKTKKAASVRKQVIEVFMAWRRKEPPAQLQSQQAKPVRHLTRAEKQRENQINWKKRQFAGLAIDLDDLGVDVLSIDMTIVIAFGRAMRLQGAR